MFCERAWSGGAAVKATARSHPNIALIKYWGKRDDRLVLPHQSSLSVTLAPLSVTTTVEFTTVAAPDTVRINGADAVGTELSRVSEAIALVRADAKRLLKRKGGLGAAKVISHGNFPASAGLASSAAAFAALAMAARAAAGLPKDERAASILARRGSGSACRSIAGGFVRWNRGKRKDGADSYGEQLFDEHHWPGLRMVVGMVSREEKAVKSRDGMRSTVKNSPFYPAWAKSAELDCVAMAKHVKRRDLQAVGELAERNAWRMHASALGNNPPLCYLKPATLEMILALDGLRRSGVPIWFTLDAGPNPVLLTDEANEDRAAQLAREMGAEEVVRCRPGGPSVLLTEVEADAA